MRKPSRHLYSVIALFLVVGVVGVAVGYQYPAIFGTVTVLEPITITPPIMSFTAYPNQRITLNFTITNTSPRAVTVTINATVVTTPLGGNYSDIRFITPSSFDALQGKNDASLTATVDNGAVPGIYRISVTFCRLSDANRICRG